MLVGCVVNLGKLQQHQSLLEARGACGERGDVFKASGGSHKLSSIGIDSCRFLQGVRARSSKVSSSTKK